MPASVIRCLQIPTCLNVSPLDSTIIIYTALLYKDRRARQKYNKYYTVAAQANTKLLSLKCFWFILVKKGREQRFLSLFLFLKHNQKPRQYGFFKTRRPASIGPAIQKRGPLTQ